MRTLNELIDVDGPAWLALGEELGAGAVPVEVLPADPALAHASLLQLQVTARSYLGAVVLHSGGLLLDDGWLRVLGSPAADRSRLSGAPDQFYADLRWPGWRVEVAELNGGRGLSLYPPLWSAEGRGDLAATSRCAVPMGQLLGFARETGQQFDGVDPGFMGTV